MNACINKIPLNVFLIVSVAILAGLFLTTMPVQQSETTVEIERDFVSFSEVGTIEFANTQFGYPILETLPPADLGIGIEKTIDGYTITNNNDRFVFLTFDTFVEGFGQSVIIGPGEKVKVLQDVAISMSFPDRLGIIGSPGSWGFISPEEYTRITS